MARQIKADLVVKDKATKNIKKVEKQTTTSFNKMKSSADGLATAWKSTLAPLAALVVASAALTKAFKDNIAYGDKLGKVSTRLGINVKALDKLNKIADLSAVSHNKLATSLQRLTRRIAEAAQGTGVAKDALEELGLDANKLAQMPLDRKFLVIATALDKVKNQGDKVRLTMKLMDSEGVTLIQMFDNLESKFDSISSMWDNQSAKSMEEFGDNLTIIGQAIGDISVVLTQEIVDMMNNLVDIKGDPNALKEWSENAIKNIKAVSEEARKAFGIIGKLVSAVWDLAGVIESGIKGLDNWVNKEYRANKKLYDQRMDYIKKLNENPTSATKMFPMPEKPQQSTKSIASPEVDQEALARIKEIQKRTQRELNRLIKLSADERVAILSSEYKKESSLLIEHGEETSELYKAYRLKVLEIGKEVSDKQNELDEAAFEKKREITEQYAGILESNMGNAFASMIDGSKNAEEAFADMASGIIADLTRLILKMIIYKTIASAVGYNVGGFSGWGAAEGGVAQGGFTPFASGGVVTKPTAGLVGEGMYNEAIVPLPNGKAIPVDMKGQTGTTIVNNINVESSGGDASKDREQAHMIATAIDIKIRQSLIKEQRPGGLIHGGNR